MRFRIIIFILIIIPILFVSIYPIGVSANSDLLSVSRVNTIGLNGIKRLSIGASGYEGHEINRPAALRGIVYYLYQRPTSRPANPFLKLGDTPMFTFIDEYGEQPQTYWMHYKHDDEILWVGQILQLDHLGNLMHATASTVLLNGDGFQARAIPDTVNCNELVGVAHYNGKWYAGERSGDCLNMKTPTYSRGGGLWESDDGINWVRDMRPEKEDPINLPYGRELQLATLNGHLYGFYQGWSIEDDAFTLIRRINTNEDVCETPRLNLGLIPFQIGEGFDWKGYIPLRTGEGLGWFDGNNLSFQHFEAIEGREIQDVIPIGIYEDILLVTARSQNEYTVLGLSEPFGKPVKISKNWMAGWGARGVVDGDFAYFGVACDGYSALDRLLLKKNELTGEDLQRINDFNHWMALINENEEKGLAWFIGVPYTWWHYFAYDAKTEFVEKLMYHIGKEDEPLWTLRKYSLDS